MPKLTDRLHAGEPSAFEELYHTYAPRCLHYLCGLLASRERAEDVLHTVFLRLLRHRSAFSSVSNLRAYLFTVCRNEALRALGRNPVFVPLPTDAQTTPHGQCDSPHDLDAVLAVYQQLPAPCREIVHLKIYGELTFREIATLLKLPQGTVATRYRSAVEQMRTKLVRQPT
jgi:RNA polymerase sigma-70 factor (ECF subfamily)